MHAIRIRKKLESETLSLAELKPLIGKTVESSFRLSLAKKRHPLRNAGTRRSRPQRNSKTTTSTLGGTSGNTISHAHDHLP